MTTIFWFFFGNVNETRARVFFFIVFFLLDARIVSLFYFFFCSVVILCYVFTNFTNGNKLSEGHSIFEVQRRKKKNETKRTMSVRTLITRWTRGAATFFLRASAGIFAETALSLCEHHSWHYFFLFFFFFIAFWDRSAFFRLHRFGFFPSFFYTFRMVCTFDRILFFFFFGLIFWAHHGRHWDSQELG